MKRNSAQSRQATLDKLQNALEADERIGGLLLVGSGAYGFQDEYSDLDLAVVVAEGQDAIGVFQDWETKVRELLPVVWGFSEVRGSEVGLLGVMLEDFLEVDISFQPLTVLSAGSANWSLLFDRTGRIEGIMRASERKMAPPDLDAIYALRLNSIWHYISNAAVSIKRGHYWRATHYIGILRDRTIELEGLLHQRQTRHFREVDQLPEDVLSALEETLPRELSREELERALVSASDRFFESAARIDKQIGSKRSDTLKKAMGEYLKMIGLR